MRSPSLIPNPLFNDRQYAQFYHQDIAGLSDSELRTELYARGSCIWKFPDLTWLAERVEKLEAELMRRRKISVVSKYTDNKPKLAEGVRL